MSAPANKGGASASPDPFRPIDWLSLAVFLAPIAVAAGHALILGSG